MLALSTSFISTVIGDGRQLLKALARYDIAHFELDSRITRTQFEQIKTNLKDTPLQVSSLHNLGIVSQAALLEAHGHRLAGLHIHDAKGLDDHLAPGLGEVEFECLKGLVDPQRPLVIELAPGTAQRDVSRAVAFAHDWF